VLFPNPRRPDPEPFQGDPRRVVVVGTALFVVALLGLLPFRAELADADLGWMLWACVAGVVLGLLGIVATRRPERAPGSPIPTRSPAQPEPPIAPPNPATEQSRPPRGPQA
jgi:hypothetical protein